MLRVGALSSASLTLFSRPLALRAEGRGGLSLAGWCRQRSWVVWMGQKLQHHLGAYSAAEVVRNEGDKIFTRVVEAEAETEGMDKPRKQSLVVVSFYKFADFPDYAEMRKPLRDLCDAHLVSGGIILSPEGINGSICGTRDAVDKIISTLQSDVRFENMRTNEAPATEDDEDVHHGQTEKSPLGAGDDAPFRWGHVRVKLKSEVVSLGIPGVKPSKKVGEYVDPKDWNALISTPGMILIDVRNNYEIRIGKFKGAMDPETKSFRDFPMWVTKQFGVVKENSLEDAGRLQDNALGHEYLTATAAEHTAVAPKTELPPVAMYCTGGIRCEKASSYLLGRGFDKVYHLKGGILKYLDQVSAAESMWEGECFVFDKRVAVDHGLRQGTHGLCYACKQPVNDEDRTSTLWEEGISCPHCFDLKSEEEKGRARARQIQFKSTGVIGGPGNGRRSGE